MVLVLAPTAGRPLGLPVALLVVLALAAPGAALFGLERGLAYGREHHRRITRSRLPEPAVRLAVGVALAALVGATGAAVGILAAGDVALSALPGHRRRRPVRGGRRSSPPAGAAASDSRGQ